VSDAEALGKGAVPQETIIFAKFSLLCRAGDEVEASRALLQLIDSTSSFEMALNSLVLFLKAVGDAPPQSYRKYLDYFQLIGKKFSRFTSLAKYTSSRTLVTLISQLCEFFIFNTSSRLLARAMQVHSLL
jgi:hypothetical protein